MRVKYEITCCRLRWVLRRIEYKIVNSRIWPPTSRSKRGSCWIMYSWVDWVELKLCIGHSCGCPTSETNAKFLDKMLSDDEYVALTTPSIDMQMRNRWNLECRLFEERSPRLIVAPCASPRAKNPVLRGLPTRTCWTIYVRKLHRLEKFRLCNLANASSFVVALYKILRQSAVYIFNLTLSFARTCTIPFMYLVCWHRIL